MSALDYTLDADDPDLTPMGLIVLQADETIEPEFKHHFADDPRSLYVSRLPSSPEVTHDTLSQLEHDLPAAAALLPNSRDLSVVGFGCTSASSVIGSHRVAAMIQSASRARAATDPLSATCAHAKSLGLSKLALLSPYVEEVNTPLRSAFAGQGLTTDVFGSFNEASEASVARISLDAIVTAACTLGRDPNVDAVFLSCTNLRTLRALPLITEQIGKPAFSSNSCLAWHMKQLNTA